MDLEGALVVGIGFGTLSGRALVVRVADGAEPGSAAHPCTHAVRVDARLPDYFGRGANEVLHRLGDLRRDVLTGGERS
jgi:L-ribulokinase